MSFMGQADMLSIPALPETFAQGHQQNEGGGRQGQQPSIEFDETPLPYNVNPATPSGKHSFGYTPPTTPAAMSTPTARAGTSITPASSARKTPPSRLKQPQHRSTTKARAARDKHAQLPSSKSSSVFDRLYKTQTAASKAWTPARAQARKARTPGKVGVDDTLKVFSRLHITGTVSNTSKRVQQRHPPRQTPEKSRESMLSPAKTILSPTKTPTKRLSGGKSPRKNYVYSPRMKPLTKLYFDSKYHPGLGLETIDPIKLGYSFFQAFCEYENGGIDSREIARELILAFFKQDFPAGRHWEMHEPDVEDRPGEEHSYNVRMSATYDWSDGYRVASAHGVVLCNAQKREVRVKNYIYDVTTGR